MSDTKILSAEQVRNVFRMGSDISMVQVCESHAAQAKRIEALESQVIDLLGGVVREAENSMNKSSVSVEEFKAFLFQEGIPTRNELKRLIFSHAELADDLAEKNKDLHSSKRALRRIITEHSERQRERDDALLRAEAAEAQVKALLEALPAERAEEIADAFLGTRMIRFAEMPGELRAYAEAAKPKER